MKVIPRMRDSDELVCRVLYLPPVLLCFVCVNLAACFWFHLNKSCCHAYGVSNKKYELNATRFSLIGRMDVPGQIAVQSSEADAVKWKGDILVFGVFEGCLEDKALKSLDELVGGLISDIIKEEDFSGKIGQSTYTRLAGHSFKRVGLVGLGKVNAVSKSTKVWKTLGENIATAAKTAQATSVAVLIAGSSDLSEDAKLAAASAITSGIKT